MYYILDDDLEPKKVTDVLEWANFLGDIRNRRLIKTTLQLHPVEISVSTIFTGLDTIADIYNQPPALYETVAFWGNNVIGEPEKYFTRQQALDGHVKICDEVRANLKEGKVSANI